MEDNKDRKLEEECSEPDTSSAESATVVGGLGGAVVGAVSGSALGPLGSAAGAIAGGILGAAASGAAVDALNPDVPLSHQEKTLGEAKDRASEMIHDAAESAETVAEDAEAAAKRARRIGIPSGGQAKDGSPDRRGITEKIADAITGDKIDDKTGKRVK